MDPTLTSSLITSFLLLNCVEVGLVRQVHTLFVRSAQQVVHELQVQEEVEGVRQEVREVKGGSKVEEKRTLHEHVDDMNDKHKAHDLSHGECAQDVTKCADKREETGQCALTLRHFGSQWKWSCRHWCSHRAVLPRNHVQF